jgi:hypothetical protein
MVPKSKKEGTMLGGYISDLAAGDVFESVERRRPRPGGAAGVSGARLAPTR